MAFEAGFDDESRKIRLMRIPDELSQVFGGRAVDLRTLRETHPRLRAQVSADREVLYDVSAG